MIENEEDGINGLVKIVDFGNSYFIDNSNYGHFHTSDDGFNEYMAPECYEDIIT